MLKALNNGRCELSCLIHYAQGEHIKGASIQSTGRSRRHLPAIRQHEHVTTHLDEKYFCKWYTMAMVPAISMKHENSRTCGGKLQTINQFPEKKETS
jgi:hypothetical protein